MLIGLHLSNWRSFSDLPLHNFKDSSRSTLLLTSLKRWLALTGSASCYYSNPAHLPIWVAASPNITFVDTKEADSVRQTEIYQDSTNSPSRVLHWPVEIENSITVAMNLITWCLILVVGRTRYVREDVLGHSSIFWVSSDLNWLKNMWASEILTILMITGLRVFVTQSSTQNPHPHSQKQTVMQKVKSLPRLVTLATPGANCFVYTWLRHKSS